jgi:hypothetical protein
MSNELGTHNLSGQAVALGLELRYPLVHLQALTQHRSEGWEIRYREPWLELWRSSVLHAYSLRIETDSDGATLSFPESWIAEKWFQWSRDLNQHRELVVSLLDSFAGFATEFNTSAVSGNRQLYKVTFSGVARNLADVKAIEATLRDQVLQMQRGRA